MRRGTGRRAMGWLSRGSTPLASHALAALLAAGCGGWGRVRAWPDRRVALAALVGVLLLSAALLGPSSPLQAQDGDAAQGDGAGDGPSIRFDDLVPSITHTIVHLFTVEVDGLSSSAAYEVVVLSDSTSLGIGGCGWASQTRVVTGATSQHVEFIVYACAVGGGTVTAELRQGGADSAEASVSQDLTVLPIPDYVPADERSAPGAAGATAREGTPGVVQNVRVANRWSTSFKITWSPPAGNGGEPLTGYGLLIWRQDVTQPPYSQAASIGVTDHHTFSGLQPSTGYKFKIHACNGTDSCGWWTDATQVTTAGRADPPHTITFDQVRQTSARARWKALRSSTGSGLRRPTRRR